MGRRAKLALMVWLLLMPGVWAAGQPQLLTIVPLSKGASSETKVPLDPNAQVLVELRVAKGDTLWKFAKRYLKRPQYYAQFLVYNDIKNPRRIYPGQTLWVPLGPVKDHPEIFSGQPMPRWILLRSDLPTPAQPAGESQAAPSSPGETVSPPQEAPPVHDLSVPDRPAGGRQADPAQAEFEQDLDLFHRGDYSAAAGKFQSFLGTYPDSPLRIKAEYYLAESYRLLEQEP